MQGVTGGVAKEGIVQVDCKGSGGLLEGWAVLRRGSGQGGRHVQAWGGAMGAGGAAGAEGCRGAV